MSTVFNNDYYNDKTITRDFSLKNTHIGYENLITSVTASSSAAGFGASALLNGFTYDFWRSGSATATLTLNLGGSRAVDYIGLAKHNLAGRELKLSSSTDGVTYSDLLTLSLTDNGAAMVLFDEVTASHIRVDIGQTSESTIYADFTNQQYLIDDNTDNNPQISVLNIGKSLEMQRMIFGGHSPSKLNTNAELRPNTSEGGAWLGRSVIRSGVMTEYSFSNLTGAWYRSKFDPFAKHAINDAFFIAWRPLGYASECQYAWTDKPISPNNTGPKDWLGVSFNVVGCE